MYKRQSLAFGGGYTVEAPHIRPGTAPQPVKVSVRPEEFVLHPHPGGAGLPACVDDSVFLGLNTHYFAHLESGEKVEIVEESEIGKVIEKGTAIRLEVKKQKINVFSQGGETSLMEEEGGVAP